MAPAAVHRMPSLRVLLLLGVALGGVHGFASLSGSDHVDPMPWTAPAVLPEIATTLSPDAYAQRLPQVLADVSIGDLEASTMPTAGVEIYFVKKGSQAERAHLAIGQIITAVDGRPLRFLQDLGPRHASLDVWDPSSGPRQVAVVDGMLGINALPRWRPELSYVRQPGRLAAADRDMVAAGMTYLSDPEFALAALAHAQAAGYSGIYLHPLQACACFQMGRYAEALAYGLSSIAAVPMHERASLIFALYGAALLDYHLPEAASILDRCPDLHEQSGGFADYLASHRRRLAQRIVMTNPLQTIATLPSFDLADMLHCSYADGSDATIDVQKCIKGIRKFSLSIPNNNQMDLEIALPPATSIECSIDFRIGYTDLASFDSAVTVFFAKPGLKPDETGTLPFVDIIRGRKFWVIALDGLPPVYSDVSRPTGFAKDYALHLALHDGMIGATLNGHPQCFVPLHGLIPPYSLYIRAEAMPFTMTSLRVIAHDPTPPVGWKPVDPAKLPSTQAPIDSKGAADF